MKKEGYDYTSDQVLGRWKTLLRAYKQVKLNNKKSGAGRKVFEYEAEMDKILKGDPVINPVKTLGSRPKRALDDIIVEEPGEHAPDDNQVPKSKEPNVKRKR